MGLGVPPSDVTACEAINNLLKIKILLDLVSGHLTMWCPMHVVMHYYLIQKNACTTCTKLICLFLGQSILMSVMREMYPNFEK